MRTGEEEFIIEARESGLEDFPLLLRRELPESSPPTGSSDSRVWRAMMEAFFLLVT